MGKMNIVLSDKTAVAYHKGMRKGNISEAAEEAFNLWIDKNSSTIRPK